MSDDYVMLRCYDVVSCSQAGVSSKKRADDDVDEKKLDLRILLLWLQVFFSLSYHNNQKHEYEFIN